MAHDPAAIDTHAAARTRHAVLIVDDHPLYRAGLKAALAPLALHVAEAASLLAALNVVGAHRFDLILYDWHLPDGGGLKGLVAMRQLAPDVPVVVITADEDETIAFVAASIGALACLSKASDAQRLRDSLGPLLGAAPSPPQPARAATAPVPDAARPLTRRQHDVLQLLARGDSNKRIAARLGIAETTVRCHVSDLLQLLQAHNRTEAVILAQRDGLVSAGPQPLAQAAPAPTLR